MQAQDARSTRAGPWYAHHARLRWVSVSHSVYMHLLSNLLADASDAIDASACDPWGMANISKRCIFSLLSAATRTHDDTHDATCTMHAASLPSSIRAGAQVLV